MLTPVTNVRIAGLGGQGVITAANLLADTAFRSGLDVKQSEIHGMSQRGGSVYSDVRFGSEVLSPMIPEHAADFLLVLAPDQVENNADILKPQGRFFGPDAVDPQKLPNRRSLNLALLGALSRELPFAESVWEEALAAHFPEPLRTGALAAFRWGRTGPSRAAAGQGA